MFKKKAKSALACFLSLGITVSLASFGIIPIKADAAGLPSGYTQLEYVYFNENSFNETMEIPYMLTANTDIFSWELDASNIKTNSGANASLVGFFDWRRTGYLYSSGSRDFEVAIGSGDVLCTYQNGLINIIDASYNNKFKITAKIDGLNQTIDVNETKNNQNYHYDDFSANNKFNGGYPLNQSFVVTGCCLENNEFVSFKFYGVRIYDENNGQKVLKVDMVPAKDSKGLEGGYDKVSGQFYPKFVYNQGITITFDTQGGSGTTPNVTGNNSGVMSDLNPANLPTKDGMIFDGYYSSPNGKGTKYYDKDGKACLGRFAFKDAQTTLYAHYVSKGSSAPASTPSQDEPLLQSYSVASGVTDAAGTVGAVVSGVCTLAEQGPLCVAAFEAATPAGYDEAFSFNFSVDNNNSDMTNYDRKAGTFVLNIPKAYQMPGRTFSIIGVNESGLTKVFTDVDISDTTLTTVLDIEGYAFSLIYTDDPSARITGTAAGGNGYYIVKPGDTLSAIAGRVGRSLKSLINKNNISNPDKISVGQKIYY